MATPTLQRWTYARAEAELPPDARREIIGGELIMSPTPIPAHQECVTRLLFVLRPYVTARRLGHVLPAPLDVVLADDEVVQPEVIYVSKQNRIIGPKRVAGVPDLLVEVISPGSVRRDRVDKKALYERCGVGEYWLVDLNNRAVEVWTLREGRYQLHGLFAGAETLTSVLLADFAVPVAELLPGEDWLDDAAD